MASAQRWYSIRAKATDPRHAEILLMGDIGESWSQNSVTASAFVAELQELDADAVTVRVNSAGGSVPDGLAIFSALRRFPGDVEVAIEGMALSIASLIAMAGDRVTMAEGGQFLVHAPWMVTAGNAPQLREQAAVLDGWAEAMVSCYARPGVDPEAVRGYLRSGKDFWFTAQEAVDAGFVDEIVRSHDVAASFVLSPRFTPPARIAGSLRTPNMPIPTDPTADDQTDGLTRSQRRRARTDVLAAAGARREIATMFAAFRNRPGVSELETSVLAAGADADTASRLLLEHLGRDASPARPAGCHPHVETLVDETEARRDLMVDALVARAARRAPKSDGARRYMAMSMTDMARHLLTAHGERTDFRSPVDLVNAAFTHGTGDFPFLLEETGHRLLREGYQAAPSGLKAAGRGVIAEDFRALQRLQFSEAPALKEVKELGEYTHGSFTEAKESYRVKTFGRIFGISRQAIVNDDLGALTRIPRAFGQAAAQFEAQYLVDLLLSNNGAGPVMSDGKTLFHADHKNLDNAATNLVGTVLASVIERMRKQKGMDGVTPINVPPKYLIVGAGNELWARQLTTEIAPAAAENVNPFWRDLTVIVEPRLDDAATPVPWYLVADPMIVDGLEYAHLGASEPMVETRVGWEVDGMEFKVRDDFGAAFLDWRSWFKAVANA